MNGNYVTPRYDRTAIAGIVAHVKTNGQLDVQSHDSGISVSPAPYRSFVGSPTAGFHGVPNLGDNVALIFGPNNKVLAAVPILSPDNTLGVVMPSLNAGESGQFHSDGRVADYLPNSGGATLYEDPTNNLSFTATALGFVMNLLLSVLNLVVGGTLNVTGLTTLSTLAVAGLATLTGGATMGANLAMGGHDITGAGSVTATGIVQGSGIVGTSTVSALAYIPLSGTRFPISGVATVSTSPGAGAAGALPATPAGYLNVTIGGINRVIPFY